MYEAEGLGSFDGILGLSNHHSEAKNGLNFVQQLKANGVISEAMVSFSVAPGDSFAMFGEYNLDQVIGGEKGMWTMPTYAYLPDFIAAQKNWALEG